MGYLVIIFILLLLVLLMAITISIKYFNFGGHNKLTTTVKAPIKSNLTDNDDLLMQMDVPYNQIGGGGGGDNDNSKIVAKTGKQITDTIFGISHYVYPTTSVDFTFSNYLKTFLDTTKKRNDIVFLYNVPFDPRKNKLTEFDNVTNYVILHRPIVAGIENNTSINLIWFNKNSSMFGDGDKTNIELPASESEATEYSHLPNKFTFPFNVKHGRVDFDRDNTNVRPIVENLDHEAEWIYDNKKNSTVNVNQNKYNGNVGEDPQYTFQAINEVRTKNITTQSCEHIGTNVDFSANKKYTKRSNDVQHYPSQTNEIVSVALTKYENMNSDDPPTITLPIKDKSDTELSINTSNFIFNNIYVIVQPIYMYNKIPILLISFSFYNNVMDGNEQLMINYLTTFFNYINTTFRNKRINKQTNNRNVNSQCKVWLSGFIDNLININLIIYALQNSQLYDLYFYFTSGTNSQLMDKTSCSFFALEHLNEPIKKNIDSTKIKCINDSYIHTTTTNTDGEFKIDLVHQKICLQFSDTMKLKICNENDPYTTTTPNDDIKNFHNSYNRTEEEENLENFIDMNKLSHYNLTLPSIYAVRLNMNNNILYQPLENFDIEYEKNKQYNDNNNKNGSNYISKLKDTMLDTILEKQKKNNENNGNEQHQLLELNEKIKVELNDEDINTLYGGNMTQGQTVATWSHKISGITPPYTSIYPQLHKDGGGGGPVPSAPPESIISFTPSELLAKYNTNGLSIKRTMSFENLDSRSTLSQSTVSINSYISYNGSNEKSTSPFISHSVSLDSIPKSFSDQNNMSGFILQTKDYNVIYDNERGSYILPKKKIGILKRLLK